MKGLAVFCMCLLSLGAEASLSQDSTRIIGLKTLSGEIIMNLNLHESSKVLESLKTDSNIEIRDLIIYPEEVSQVYEGKLTNMEIIAKRPNQSDYN